MDVGIIPACAGNTAYQWTTRRLARDHPRMCGEHMSDEIVKFSNQGSSPHVRGTPAKQGARRPFFGIIPACAGNTYDPSRPRQAAAGSSPHVRGTLVGELYPRLLDGIIPACAGNTPQLGCPCTPSRDHPRMCGEHPVFEVFFDSVSGSSPHVRGTPLTTFGGIPANGIIPACAGNTSGSPWRAVGARDHPRMCGEHLGKQLKAVSHAGSSPHVRGTLGRQCANTHPMGIIPACAGNTSRRSKAYRMVWDHPRMCGEHYAYDSADITGMGSSPHVRGTPLMQRLRDEVGGIIPACAGNTCSGRW